MSVYIGRLGDLDTIKNDIKFRKIQEEKFYNSLKILNENIQKKNKSDTLILIEWDKDYYASTCILNVMTYFNKKYKNCNIIPILYDKRKNYYFVHDVIELNDEIIEIYHNISNNLTKLCKKIEIYDEFKNNLKMKYKNIIACNTLYFTFPCGMSYIDITNTYFDEIYDIYELK
jgi:hypothetical protein